MKQTAMILAVLTMSAASFAQNNSKPASQTTPAGQTAGQATTPAAPQGKRPPQAKTQPEFEAYKAVAAITDAAAQEKAADDFATKYPDSELRPVLYKAAMHSYQQANNADKMMEMARKVLTYDPDDPEALLAIAQVLAERTHDTDLDKDQKLAEARKDADQALKTIDTDVPTGNLPAEQVEQYKNFLRSEAYVILGTMDFNAKDYAPAETNLRKSIDVFPQQPDPVAVFRLAVALDMQKKYPEAMKYCNQAVELTKDHPDTGAGKAARDEQSRLTQLASGTAPGQPATVQK